ncbi:MAG TPA: glycine--tRNA ligase subunit beta [Trueperaceae bacterium]|nr:glycine--tRNA ligase subunit beta [Trueperaceae bacterium]
MTWGVVEVDSADLLFEIGTEELPSWYVEQGSTALVELLSQRLAAAGFAPEAAVAYGTPRRLSVIARGVPLHSPERVEERRGPGAGVAFAADGTPTRAAEAFAKSSGVPVTELEVRENDKGASYVYAKIKRGGEEAAAVLPGLLASVVTDLPAQRKMRWASEPVAFVRPVSWLLALLGDRPLNLDAAGVTSSATTRGHRFLAPDLIEIAAPAQYAGELRAAFVEVDIGARTAATLAAGKELAAQAGLTLYRDEALLDEVAGLVEWPFPILGSFSDAYLELPEEVLATVMIKHQRFFPTRDADGALAAKFVGISNNRVPDEDLVRRGYEAVLDGRLYDASFFWRSDRRKSLSQHAWALSGIAFQKELGTLADKIARVSFTAEALADALEILGADREALTKALPLFKADLATEMVYEFPELEGVMARAYALAEGQPEPVADALLGGVMPRSGAEGLPTTAPGAVLSVADRLDKLVGFFALGKRPTGSADPFGLRRDALAVLRVSAAAGWRAPLVTLVEAAAAAYRGSSVDVGSETQLDVVAFLWDRVAALLDDHGFSPQVARAAVGGSTTVMGAVRRSLLLRALMDREEFADLMALYKRAANLAAPAMAAAAGALRGRDDDGGVRPELFSLPQEEPLYRSLPAAAAGVDGLLAAVSTQVAPVDPAKRPQMDLVGLEAPLAQVIGLKAPLDAFLDGVLVMAEDEAVKRNRLGLLAGVVAPLRRLGSLEFLE